VEHGGRAAAGDHWRGVVRGAGTTIYIRRKIKNFLKNLNN